MEYHEATAKKIHYSKLDPSLGFAFLLRSSRDFTKFKSFLENGKKIHGSNWIFNTMQHKPEFMKDKRATIASRKSRDVLEFDDLSEEPTKSVPNRQTFEQFRKIESKSSVKVGNACDEGDEFELL